MNRPFPWAGFLVLAFVIVLAVTTETMPTGLLPDMSRSLGVSEPAIGLLVTIYAFSVAVVSIPLIALTRRWQRHRLLALSVAVLGLSSVLSALAPTYELVVATRVFGGLGHAVFWATVGAYPGHAVAREQIAKAVGIVLGGSTLGFVLGVPIATFIGHAVGWRPTFGAVGVVLVMCALLVWRFLPAVAPVVRPPHRERRRDATIVPVLIVCLLALVCMTGHYTFYTYIAPYAIGILGISPDLVGPLLLLTGIAGSIGLVLSATVFAVRASRGMMVGLVASAVAVSSVALSTHELWLALPSLFIWSVALGMLPALMQTRILHVSSAAFRDAGNAVYTAAFNVGIGGGALVGALVYSAGGLTPLPWVDVAILVLSCVFVVATRRWDLQADPAAAPARVRPRLRARQSG